MTELLPRDSSAMERYLRIASSEARDRLGELAVKRGLIQQRDLDEALWLQREDPALCGRPLAEVLLARGRVSPEEVKWLLREQRRRDLLASISPEAELDGEGGGRRVGRFMLVRLVGEGGGGQVWRAWDTGLNRWVALKLFYLDIEEKAVRFRREAQSAAALRHPNIVALHDFGVSGSLHYLAMDFIDTGPADRGPLPVERALQIVSETADALAYLHSHGIVHRDVKPGNILLGRDGRAYLADFGLARVVDESSRVSSSSAMVGTPAYMAPEQVRGLAAQIDSRTDVYGLGATLYEYLTGKLPFAGSSLSEITGAILREDPTPPRRLVPKIPGEVEKICLKAMEKSRANRYLSASDMAADIRRFLNGDPIFAQPTSRWYRVRKRIRKSPRLYAAAAAAAVTLAAALTTAAVMHARYENARDEAIANAATTADRSLEAALALRRHGAVAEMNRFLPDVEQACRRAVALAPDAPEPHYYLGRMYRALLRFDEALAEQEAALAASPAYAPSLYERAVLLSRRYAERLDALERQALSAEGSRLAEGGMLKAAGLGGAHVAPPRTEEIEANDPGLTELRGRIIADIETLKWKGGVEPARIDCAEGILLAHRRRFSEAAAAVERALGKDPYIEEGYEAMAALALRLGTRARAYPEEGVDPEAMFLAAVGWATRGIEHDAGYAPHRLLRAQARFEWARHVEESGGDPQPRYEEALADFAALPDDADALTRRGSAKFHWAQYVERRGGDTEQTIHGAVEDFNRAIAIQPRHAEAYLRRGVARAELAARRRERGADPEPEFLAALADLDAALAIRPDDPEALMHRGSTRLAIGYYRFDYGMQPGDYHTPAFADFDRALRVNPHYLEALTRRAFARIGLAYDVVYVGGDPGELFADALRDCDAALAIQPDHLSVLMFRGWALLTWGFYLQQRGRDPRAEYADAGSSFDRAAALAPDSPDTAVSFAALHAMRAWHRHDHGEAPEDELAAALARCEEALAVDPDSPAARFVKSGALLLRAIHEDLVGRDPAESIRATVRECDGQLEENPRSLFTLAQRAYAMVLGGKFDAAVRDGDAALKINPRSVEALERRAHAYAEWGRAAWRGGEPPDALLGRAIDDADAALAINPASFDAHLRRGTARGAWGRAMADRGEPPGGRYDEAMGDLTRALELRPDSAEAHWERGRVRLWADDAAGALEDFEAAAGINRNAVRKFAAEWEAAKRQVSP